MQEFHVKVDLGFINEIFEMLSSETTEAEAVRKFILSRWIQSTNQ